MRRRFIEALRRAEIISLVAAARDERELGSSVAEELCGAYDAEIGIVAEIDATGRRRAIAVIGAGDAAGVLSTPELSHATSSSRAIQERGLDLLGVGGRTSLLSGYRSSDGNQIVIGVARLYEQEFDAAEVGLLEAVVVNAGQALERLRAHAERDRLIAELKYSFLGTAAALANALEAKDAYTANHASAVADLAVEVGRELGLGETELEDLRYGAAFHDIGKIAIPDAILHKPGPLDEREQSVMMTHPEIGAEIVAPIPSLSDDVKEMVRHDHERYDGGGYPDGLSGEQIPLGARIVFVADSYHAMTSDRPYRSALPKQEALEELQRNAGTQFDPAVVAAFMRVVES